MHAYVTCRADVGFAICTLAKFLTQPHKEHYRHLKHLVLYLQQSKKWSICYKRPEERNDLPPGDFEHLAETFPDQMEFPDV